jgi:hypothetical protein
MRIWLSKERKKKAATLLKHYEKELCALLIPRASRNLTKYTDDVQGFLGQFPMDILHTISKGTVPLLIDILDAYIEQSSRGETSDTGGGEKKKKKKRTKSAKRLGILHEFKIRFKRYL